MYSKLGNVNLHVIGKLSFQRLQPRLRRIAQKLRDGVDGVHRRARAENLAPRVRLDRWELVFGVIRVHGLNLVERRRPQHLPASDFRKCQNGSTKKIRSVKVQKAAKL